MTVPSAPNPLPKGSVVLDASFIIALLDGETSAQRHFAVVARSVVSAVTLGEVYAKLAAASGIEPATVQAGLLALGATLVDLPVAAAAHFPALRTIDAARRAEQRANGEKAATLSLADLAVLGHAMITELPVLTGDRHWATLLRHGLMVDVHLFRDGSVTA